MALCVRFGLVVSFSGVLTVAGESAFFNDGEAAAGGSLGEVPPSAVVITLFVEDPAPANGLGEPKEEITFGEPVGIGLGELDPATPLTLFFLKVSLARRLLGGEEEEFTFVDNTEARCSAASAFVVGGVLLPPPSVEVGAAGVVVFVGRVSDFFASEGEDGGRGGLIFSELLVPPLPELLVWFGLVFVVAASFSDDVGVVCFVTGGGGRGLLGDGVGECVFDALPLLLASKRAFSLLISEAIAVNNTFSSNYHKFLRSPLSDSLGEVV